MSDRCANVQTAATDQSNQAARQLFTAYKRDDQSPLLAWLPVLLGLCAAAIVALVFCPVPRSQTISGSGALFVAFAYVGVTVAAGAFVLIASGVIAGQRELAMSVRRLLPQFCGIAVWITPVVAFYRRDSLWAVATAAVLAVVGSEFICRHHLAGGEYEMLMENAGSQITQSPPFARIVPLTLAALLLEFAALSIMASMARPATLLIGGAVSLISFLHKTGNASNRPLPQLRSRVSLRFSITAGLAIVFVAASLTPYLAVAGRGGNSGNSSTGAEKKPTGTSVKSKLGFFKSTDALFAGMLHNQRPSSVQNGPVDEASLGHPYPVLQALFGEGGKRTGSALSEWNNISGRMTSTVLVAGESYTGMILRPDTKEHAPIAPPMAMRRLFDLKPNQRKHEDPSAIPFYGAYWFFRASDGALPADAVESRGDPASTSFKTTDFTPITMEARQNFGSLIDLSCCKGIDLVISNADRRPGTVAVELILTNTTLPGRPRQSLGILPVNSTLRWIPGDNRPPVTEVLSFRLPEQSAIHSFDEAIVRFELKSPREEWSAKIAVEKFRLVSREF